MNRAAQVASRVARIGFAQGVLEGLTFNCRDGHALEAIGKARDGLQEVLNELTEEWIAEEREKQV